MTVTTKRRPTGKEKPVTTGKKFKTADTAAIAPLNEREPEPLKQERVPGQALFTHLWSRMHENGDTTRELAMHLGIAYPTLMMLGRGERRIPGLTRETLVKAAKYLQVPVAQAYILAEALYPEDFIHEEDISIKLNTTAYDVMARDPHWGAQIPPKMVWQSLPESVRVTFIMLFEKATGISIFRYAQVEVTDPS